MLLKNLYAQLITKYPKSVLLGVLVMMLFLGFNALKLEVDASSETLLLENDKDLQFTRSINKRYGGGDFLVITYTPHDGELLSTKNLDIIQKLSSELESQAEVTDVLSILNAPLLQSPPVPLKQLVDNIPTLDSGNVDKALAKKEFLNSPVYRRNIVSEDFKTTALLVNLKDDTRHSELLQKRNALRNKETLTMKEKQTLIAVSKEFKAYRDARRVIEHENIVKIREIMTHYEKDAELFLGGVTMIADDMVSFVKGDLKIYGTIVLLLLIVVLWIIFQEVKWVLMAVLLSVLSVLSTTGVLGLFGWEVTVVSSNFISIQLIITMSLTIHLIVRYRELVETMAEKTQQAVVLETVLSMFKPSFFVVLTTIAGFSSLMFSGILPVMNLGLMMSVGIAITLVIIFLVFPALLMLSEKIVAKTQKSTSFSLIKIYINMVEHQAKWIIAGTVMVFLFTITGATKLIIENSFINYFNEDTEIYQGMKVIDQRLGGTTPLDVVVTFAKDKEEKVEAGGDDGFDDFEEEFEATQNDAQYWFTPSRMEKVEEIHNYLKSLSAVGKVLSLGTTLEVGKSLNEGEALDSFKLALIYKELPENFRKIILNPYLNIENNQVRFSLRIVDSTEGLRRDELLKKIQADVTKIMDDEGAVVRLSGIMVLYNNMLQSLSKSQITTLGFAIVVLFLMFLILFHSMKVASLAIMANVIPIGVIFGFMGWFGIPLDMMTITIAAISIGMGVDNTIHYIHRYKTEFDKDGDGLNAMRRTHNSIGYAMYYTSFAIMIGFMILVFSNFLPTIYFGLLTALAMFTALSADLLLLPKLLLVFKPFVLETKK